MSFGVVFLAQRGKKDGLKKCQGALQTLLPQKKCHEAKPFFGTRQKSAGGASKIFAKGAIAPLPSLSYATAVEHGDSALQP